MQYNSIIYSRILKAISINPDRTVLIFHFADNNTTERFVCTADCCSQTWIEHITLPELPTKIIAIEDKDLNSFDDPNLDFVQVYSKTFRTEKGDALVVEFRNSSNGYYGGDLELKTDQQSHNYGEMSPEENKFNNILVDF